MIASRISQSWRAVIVTLWIAQAASVSGMQSSNTKYLEWEASTGRIVLPVADLQKTSLHDSFNDMHNGHLHHAIDIMQPRGTPVLAVTDGIVAKLYDSKAGGNTIYEFDNPQRFCFYYAHLNNYATGLREGSHIYRGNVIGYVGSTGNANAPHLHFAIYELDSTRAWWKGMPIDPFPVLAIAADKSRNVNHQTPSR